jgi:hypothetical protein
MIFIRKRRGVGHPYTIARGIRKREEKTKMSLEVISERFRRFAIRECRDSSELYEQLALNIAEDDELLRLASAARSGQPIPNLLFGAVHYLLLKGYRHELREFYGSIVDQPRNPQHAFPYFRDFCIHYQEDITAMLTSKLVQTNEVRRCAYLYPSFCFIYNIAKKPLSLIEIGTSAGLQLAWDKYRYDYGLHETYGNPHSNVVITSEICGERLPFLLPKSPPAYDSPIGKITVIAVPFPLLFTFLWHMMHEP